MKIGIIYVGYNTQEYIDKSLQAWIEARNQRLDDHEFLICAVSVPFEGFPSSTPDRTIDLLYNYYNSNDIDNLITEPKNIHETQARGLALEWLKNHNIDIVCQVDSDEFFTLNEISRIFKFVEFQPFIAWFRLSLKNYIFNQNTYLEEPFTPARIFRIKVNNIEASHFIADNDIAYGNINPRDLPSITIPKNVAWIKHITWLSDKRSKDKIDYHESHFISRPPGVRCSYKWIDNKLCFNDDYYKFVGSVPPTILSE